MDFATTSDLEARWRALTAEEEAVAEELIADASAQIRSEVPTIDYRINGDVDLSIDPDLVLARNATRVVCGMVRRAMSVNDLGVSSVQEATGPFSATTTFTNPMGDLYLTKAEKRLLGSGRTSAGAVDTAPAASVVFPWPVVE